MKIMVINGPNLNMLGVREKNIYGEVSYNALLEMLQREAERRQVELTFFQSNLEGEIVSEIQNALFLEYDGIIINPGAYTHYSYAILDAIKAANRPAIEVHISNIHQREEFRHRSVTAPACVGQIAGLGLHGYVLALDGLIHYLSKEKES